MLATTRSATVLGLEAFPVEVEVEVAMGLPGYQLVGLPVGALKEARVRIRAALESAGLPLPPRRVTVNLAPADLRKDGSAFDLPIAAALVVAAGGAPAERIQQALVAGELALDGSVRPIRGALPMAALARASGVRTVIVPRTNAREAAQLGGVQVLGVSSLGELVAYLRGGPPPELPAEAARGADGVAGAEGAADRVDLRDVLGQAHARRALEVAAAGGHNLLLLGPPGSGKSMLARRAGTVLPPLDEAELIEVARIYSVAGLLGDGRLPTARPVRAPHHTTSVAGLVGGGPGPRPGEVSLGHRGVLFLDELPEFRRDVIEALRQPLEEGRVTVVRARRVFTFPARFMLVAAANPCPCGFAGSTLRSCVCGPMGVARYRARLSGPLVDRIDLQVTVPAVPLAELRAAPDGEPSAAVRARVGRARERQRARLGAAPDGARVNAELTPGEVRRLCRLPAGAERLLSRLAERQTLTARGVDRALKVARTVADLAGEEGIGEEHLLEALAYRELDQAA